LPIWESISQSASTKVRDLHDWWIANRGACGIPDRSAFDPVCFPRLLPNMLVSELEPSPFRIRYRLTGTKVDDVLNLHLTGRYLDEVADEASGTPWMDYYASAYASRAPVLGGVTEATTSGGTFTFEFGIFPVTVGGGTSIGQFLCIEDYFDFRLTSAELIPWSEQT
jgi:hypothetical protein